MTSSYMLFIGAIEPPLVEQLITWVSANTNLVAGAGILLAVLYLIGKVVKGSGYAPGKRPKSAKQAKAWAQAALSRNEFRKAGELFEFAGDFEDAYTAFVRGGAYDQAAEAALSGGMKDRAAAMFEKGKKYVAAAKLYQQQRKFILAGDLYIKAGNETQAAEMYEAAGDPARAAACYEKAGFNSKAADAYLKARDFKKAGELFERSFREERTQGRDNPKKLRGANELAVKAASCFEKINEKRRAVALLSDAGFYERAAGLLRKENDLESAADLYVKANLPLQAAELYRQMGEMERAARLTAEVLRQEGNELAAAESYRQAGEFFEAAEIFRRHTRYLDSAECYVGVNDFLQAGEMYLRAKDPRKAAEAWERAGDYRRAAEVYQRLGDGRKQSELLEKSGEFYEAGINYFKLQLVDDAERVLTKVPKDHAAFKKSCVLLGDIYRDRGEAAQAVKKYQEAIAGEKVSQGNLHPYYNLARVVEGSGDPRLALALFNKIHKEDSQFSDVHARILALRQRVQEAEKEREHTAPPENTTAPVAVRTKKRYTLLSELGRGGMGIVYKAHDQVLDRVVAFKMLPSDLRGNDIAVKNFLREAKAAAGLNHPNIVIVYDAGEEADNYYIAMEYIEGRTLRDITAGDGKIPLPGLLVISAQLCKALEYAHGRSVVHRDIKGSNIMWTDAKMVKIMDFGLAKVIQEVVNFQTVVGGTPHYMAPEQILGEEIDRRADLYSLGVTLYECATGTVPFPKGDVGYHHIHTKPPDPRQFNASLPESFANILLKCLEKEPANRYQGAEEIYEDLRNVSPR